MEVSECCEQGRLKVLPGFHRFATFGSCDMYPNLFYASQFAKRLARFLYRRCRWSVPALARRAYINDMRLSTTFVFEGLIGREDIDHPPRPSLASTDCK